MTDIVERLNDAIARAQEPIGYGGTSSEDAYAKFDETALSYVPLLTDAASTITALREEVGRLTRTVNQYAYERDKAREERDQAERRSEQFWRGQLTALRQRVVEVVGPFAKWPGDFSSMATDVPVWTETFHSKERSALTIGHFRAARALVNEMETTK